MSRGTIVFVPGYWGSDLYLGPDIGFPLAGTKLWSDYARLAAGSWLFMGLKDDGVTPAVDWVGPLVPAGPSDAFYGVLRTWLSGRGWSVWSPALDWRQATALDGQRLADLVTTLAGESGPVSIIAHSRGGLVTRSALSILGAEAPNLVQRVVGLGIPHFGSVAAVALLAGWSTSFTYLLDIIEATSAPLAGQNVTGELRRLIATWPATYFLFPSPLTPDFPPEQISVMYNPFQWTAINSNVSPTWLGNALVNWATLPPPPASIPWLDVVGYQFNTPDQLASLAVPATPQDVAWSMDGDGSVTTRSAGALGNVRVTSWTSHSALVHDFRLFPYYEAWILGQLTDSVVVPGGPIE